MSFFQAQDLDPIAQRKISIPAENGLDFTPSQRVQFIVPPSTEFFQPNQCYIQADVELTFPSGKAPTKLQLDSSLGANVLIRDIRIHTMGGVLLEELQNVNTLMAVKYDYSTNESLRHKRALTEGATAWTPYTRGTRGQDKSDLNDTVTNPYFVRDFSGDADMDDTDLKDVKVCLSLPTGIFMGERVFPNALVGGLRIECVLEETRFCFRQLDGVNRHRYPTLNPQFHSINGSSTQRDSTDADNGELGPNSNTDSFFVTRTNNAIGIENFPFAIGETFRFFNASYGFAGDEDLSSNGVVGDQASDASFTITGVEYDTTNASGDAGRGLLKVTVDTSAATSASLAMNTLFVVGEDPNASGNYMYSTVTEGGYNATYTMKNVELVVGEVEMPAGYSQSLTRGLTEGGTLNYMYPSYTNYKYSQLASERVSNIRLPLNNSKARAILHIPTDATTRSQGDITSCSGTYVVNRLNDNKLVRQQGAGLRGCWDHLSNYQMIYDNRLQPSRKVDCDKTSNKESISQQPMIELEKALLMAGIDVHSFRAFQENAVIGRALALNDGVYDTRGKDYSLQVEYNETTAPAVNKLWNNWVAHLRTLQIRGDSIQVEI
jgi:hypothetical protein